VRDDGNQSITELVNSINESAEIYAQQQELAEALATLAKINEVKATEGENPAMRRAQAAQEQLVGSLSARLNPQPESAQTAAAGPRLQIVKPNSEIASIRKQNREWLQDYDRELRELVRLVAPAESFTHA
jgi:hypothetical protein